MRLGVVHDLGGDSDVVKTPSELCDHGRWFVVEPPSEAKAFGVSGEVVAHRVLDVCSSMRVRSPNDIESAGNEVLASASESAAARC
jgi:hypothetical protein